MGGGAKEEKKDYYINLNLLREKAAQLIQNGESGWAKPGAARPDKQRGGARRRRVGRSEGRISALLHDDPA